MRSGMSRPGLLLCSVLAVSVCLALIVGGGVATSATGYDWPQFAESDWSGIHGGSNNQEGVISSSNVGTLTRLFRVNLPDVADGVPAYLRAVAVGSTNKDLLFLTTNDGHDIALDAHTGTTVWSKQYGPGSCIDTNGSACYTTSSPAADPNRQYVYTYGLDGYVHRLRVGTGTEVTGSGWPEGATLKPSQEKTSPALSIAQTSSGTYLYVASGGYPGDAGDYQGHITAINLASGAQRVFNTLCSNQAVHFTDGGTPDCGQTQSAVWARPGVVYDPDTNKIYFATGNGDYAPTSHDWGDSVLALNLDGTGSSSTPGDPVDSYTPTNYAALQAGDTDLGSTAPAILPTSAIPGSSLYKHLAIQSGKDGIVRLLNLDNLSGQGGPGHTGGELASVALPNGSNEVLSQPAVWINPADGSIWMFVTNNNEIAAYTLTVDGSGAPGLQLKWSATGTSRDSLGSSPLVANGVLFDARPNLIEARNPTTGQQLWADTSIGDIHWEHPMVANGTLYIMDESAQLTAYSLPQAAFTSTLLTSGWNSIGIPSNSYTDAAGLISDIQGQNAGLTVRVVATYQSGRFAIYVPGYSQTLSFQPARGVYALTSTSGSWTPQGAFLGPMAISVQAGWNFLSLTYPGSMHASSICSELIAADSSCQEVAVYQNGAYTAYLPGGGGTDFTVTRDQGFMVLTTSAGSWTPS